MGAEFDSECAELKEAREKLSAWLLKNFFKARVEPNTIDQIKKQAAFFLEVLCKKSDEEHINFSVNPGLDPNEITIKPLNLFTALLMHGVYVPWVLVGSAKEWNVGYATIAEDGQGGFVIRPAALPEIMMLNFTIDIKEDK